MINSITECCRPKAVIVRRATKEDIDAFFPKNEVKPTMKAWVGEVDGKALGIGGMALMQGRWFAFFDLKDEGRVYRRAIVKAAKAVLADARASGIRFVYAEADPEEKMSMRWLRSLGFEVDERTGFLMRWRA